MLKQVLCNRRGNVLYEGMELPTNEIIQSFDGKCPKCGKSCLFYQKTLPAQVRSTDEVKTAKFAFAGIGLE